VIVKIDKILETLPQSSILIPEIFAEKISERVSEVSGLLEILCDEKLLIKKKYFECSNPDCESLIEISQYEQALEDGDLFECSWCQIDLTRKKMNEVTVFRFNPDKFITKISRISDIISSQDFPEGNIISILFLSADPSDASRLRLGEEFREIQEKLTSAKLRDRFKLEIPQLSARPSDVSQALLDIQPQIVHFSGHGSSDGALCFEDNNGKAHLIEPDALTELFKQFTPRLVCVVLNACYSEQQAKAIGEHVKYVIGMKTSIGDNAAIAYAIGFYQALGAGQKIEKAHEFGCIHIRMQNIPEHLTPILFSK
jgi:hypothetical protein